LFGHEDWVTSLTWITSLSNETSQLELNLVSTSMDRSVLVWGECFEEEESFDDGKKRGIWDCVSKMGEVGGTLGGPLGAHVLGFLNGACSIDGLSLLIIAYSGSFHLWRRETIERDEEWKIEPFLSGHFGEVTDLEWMIYPKKQLRSEDSSNLKIDDQLFQIEDFIPTLFSVSKDQTCRVIGGKNLENLNSSIWSEISRPSIHGHDLNTISLISPTSCVIGGEEKVLRVLDMTESSFHTMEEALQESLKLSQQSNEEFMFSTPLAYMPELNLSTRALEQKTQDEVEREEYNLELKGTVFDPREDQEVEEELEENSPNLPKVEKVQTGITEKKIVKNSLWCERKKLYQHYNEIVTCQISNSKKVLVSSCKSRDEENAKICFWDATSTNWDLMGIGGGHSSTVIKFAFSPIDDRFLVSVGRDRKVIVFDC